MRRVAAVIVAVLALASTAGAAERNPRLEQVRLNAADNALARSIAITQREAGAGFRKTAIPSGDQQLSCPGFNPNVSRFTITGKSTTAYVHASGASIVSAVEVFESRADASGDFRAAATPAVARCLRLQLQRDLGATGLTASIRSASVVPAPRVAERRIAYRIVARLTAGTTAVTITSDVVVLQRGRSIAALFFTAVEKPFPRRDKLSAAVAARMR